MIFFSSKKFNSTIIKFTILLMIFLLLNICQVNKVKASETYSKEDLAKAIEQIFQNRNKSLINGDLELIESIYDKNSKYGTWAYEHEVKKMKYIKNWQEKQGVRFIDIIPTVVVKSIKGNGNCFSLYLICSAEYKYVYEDQPEIVNSSRVGTYHVLQIENKDGFWVIKKEWYKDPFADSLNLDNIKVDSVKQYITSQNIRDFSNINARRNGSIEYAKTYCGAASEEEYGFTYNKKYRDYNPQGGDCANFASQTLFEGGKFKKNSSWNYDKDGATRSWLNADGFKNYMVGSGRASVIAHGDYQRVYKASYKLLPGDFIAYEKNGDINHISMVTGADSKGYTLVTCHNSDRNRVPWDLGWSNKEIKFWLVHVNY